MCNMHCLIGTSGQYKREGIPSGDYIIRIVARDPANSQEKSILRNRVRVPVDNTFCSVGLLNRGLTVSGDSTTIEFYSTGVATGFQCVLDHKETFEDCKKQLIS